jgi:aerobic-type carbon monoxide dehydrogenase small subunit (CoxS/CutS family)
MNEDRLNGESAVMIETEINGVQVARQVEARQNLADFLRETLNITSPHLGCEHGICGACNVMLDGRTVRSCLTLAAQADRSTIETIEGLERQGVFTRLQEAFIASGAAQCSFCTSGMLLTAYELLISSPSPSRHEIRDAISGNLCRCTGYHAIVDAVEMVAQQRGRA